MLPMNIMLIAHVVGALVLGIFIVQAVISLLYKKNSSYKPLTIQIGLGAGYQLITGSLLATNIHTMQSLTHFCNRMAIYVGIVVVIEALLLHRMEHEHNWIVPARIAFSSITLGVSFTLI